MYVCMYVYVSAVTGTLVVTAYVNTHDVISQLTADIYIPRILLRVIL
eukprot:SAG31_NODE_109_length_24587_cov_111.480848_14_plen_47_part_00